MAGGIMKGAGTILDKWANLSHKAPLGESAVGRLASKVDGWEPSSWTGEEHRRRLTAYMVLAAYRQNVSRHFLTTSDESDRDERREYGDAALVVDSIVAHILGETQDVVVEGAEAYDPELTDTFTDTDPDTGEERDRAATDEELEALAENAAAGRLADRQEFLRTWADDVHLPLRLIDTETNAVGLGDGAILLGWDAQRQQVIPSVMDPGFYFPVQPDSLDAYEYPTRVHFAWEVPGEDFRDGKARVRRITYDLRDLFPSYDENLDEWVMPEGTKWVTAPRRPGDDLDIEPDRYLVREYPWHPGEPSRQTCYVTDAEWILDDLKDAGKPDAFDLDNASRIRTDADGLPLIDYDLGLDFLPVIHVPNTPAGGDHFGESSLAKVLQILDDLQNADTDTERASATTGSPIIVRRGAGNQGALLGIKPGTSDVRPGTVWDVSEHGGVDTVDTAANLEATRAFVTHLLDRLSINSRLPAAVLGRLNPSEVPSGFAMQLSFGPLTSMIRTMRHVRAVKYPLMLKMVQRIYQANGVLEAGETPRAEIVLGAYLPSDIAGVLDTISKAYPKFMSLETAVKMLMDVGVPIDDAAEEIARIEARDYEGADQLADATGDVNDARTYLGLDPKPAPEPTQVILDPTANRPGGAPLVVPE